MPQPPVNVPPPVEQTTPPEQQPSTAPVTQPVSSVEPVTTNNQTTPAQPPPRPISPLASAPRGPARPTPSQSDHSGPQTNSKKHPKKHSGPGNINSPRGRLPSPRRDESRRYSISPAIRRRPSDQYSRDPYPSSPRTQHPIPRFPTDPREPAPRIGFATRVTTPPIRASYRDRSRSPPPPHHQRMGSVEYKLARPIIPDEGYRRDNWDPNRGGY